MSTSTATSTTIPKHSSPDRPNWRSRRFSERGEGVISTAIAVLVIAFLGVAMWFAFQQIFNDATDTTREQVQLVGH